MKISDDFWDNVFMPAARVMYRYNPEAEVADVLEHIRVEYNGGHNNYGEHAYGTGRTQIRNRPNARAA